MEMNKLDKIDKIIYFCVIPFLLVMLIGVIIWNINFTKAQNKDRYQDLPDILMVEEELETFLITMEPFSYIRYEFLNENTLVYYFVFDEPQLYYKIVYVFKNDIFMDKRWQYYKVLPSWKEEAYNE